MINKVGRFFLAKGVKFVWLFQVPPMSEETKRMFSKAKNRPPTLTDGDTSFTYH